MMKMEKPQTPLVLDIAGLTSHYGRIQALHGIDPKTMEHSSLKDTLATMPTRLVLDISAEVDEYTLQHPQVQDHEAILAALETLTRREWEHRVTPIRERAEKALTSDVAPARRATLASPIAVLDEAEVTTIVPAPNHWLRRKKFSIRNPVLNSGPKIIRSPSRAGSCSGSAARRLYWL